MDFQICQEINRSYWMNYIVNYLYKNAYKGVKKRKIETQLAACMMYEKNFSKDVFFPNEVTEEGAIMFQKSIPTLNKFELNELFYKAKKNVCYYHPVSIHVHFFKQQVQFVVNQIHISPIHCDLYKKLCTDLQRNEVPKQDWHHHIAFLLCRYLLSLKGESHQLGILYYEKLNQFETIKAEMFASPLNHTLDKFCSLYPDTDKYFGSLGSVFDYLNSDKFEEGFYVANPPYHPRTMDMFMENILEKMKQVKFSILITCPVWDYDGLCELGIKEFAELYYKDVPYCMFEMAKASEFYRFHVLHHRHLHPYKDHKSQTNVNVVGTYSIFLSSREVEYEKNLYNFLSHLKNE